MNSFDTVHGVQVAVLFVWLGMVLAVSLLDAASRFRTAGIATPPGHGIGHAGFVALKAVESALAVALVICVIGTGLTQPAAIVLGSLVALLVLQLALVHETLRQTSQAVGDMAVPHPTARRVYVLLTLAKVGLILTLGVLVLSGSAR